MCVWRNVYYTRAFREKYTIHVRLEKRILYMCFWRHLSTHDKRTRTNTYDCNITNKYDYDN